MKKKRQLVKKKIVKKVKNIQKNSVTKYTKISKHT